MQACWTYPVDWLVRRWVETQHKLVENPHVMQFLKQALILVDDGVQSRMTPCSIDAWEAFDTVLHSIAKMRRDFFVGATFDDDATPE